MAAVYDYETGQALAEGLRGCRSALTHEAIDAAERHADNQGKSVLLDDDDGRWLVHPQVHGERDAADPLT